MNRSAILGLATVLFLAGCGDSRTASAAPTAPATPGSYQVGGGLSPFYAEELHENRLYVFGTKKVWEKFVQTKDMDPLNSKRLIGKGPKVGEGPQKMTIVVETTKDEPAKDKRILRTVAERYNLAL